MKKVFLTLVFSLFIEANSLNSIYFKSKDINYQPISLGEFDLAYNLFYALFNGKPIDDYLEKLKLNSTKIENYIVIEDNLSRGWGFFVFNKTGNLLLSTPHRFYDTFTGNIGINIFQERDFKAFASNTSNRKVKDLAHSKTTVFNAFHLAFSDVFQENIYQIHGFSNKNRKTPIGSNASIIVSSTTKPTDNAKAISICLNKSFNNVYLYKKDIFELGGTTNSQTILLKDNGYKTFTHIEINYTLRDDFKKSKIQRDIFSKCLF